MIHNRNFPVGRGGGTILSEPDATAGEADPGTRFELDGHIFIAVRSSARRRKKAHAGIEKPSANAVGRITCSGKHYLVYDAQHAPAPLRPAASSIAEILTSRELEIARHIGLGKCDKEIARDLGISGYTVREHIRRIFAKLHIGRRSAIVACVLR